MTRPPAVINTEIPKLGETQPPGAPATDCQPLPAENTFDKAVYGGISYGAQAGTGIILTNWIKHGGGRRYFDKMASWLGPAVIGKITGKTGKDAIEETSSWIVVSTMVMVGNTFLLPVKWLENRKPEIIRWMTERSNKKRESSGEAIPQEELQQQHTRLQQLEAQPKQNWWSLLGGRAFGLGAVYGVLWGIGNKNNERLETWSTRKIQGGLKAVGMDQAAKSQAVENYLRIGFYDVAYSAVSAGGLYVYSHLICPPEDQKHHAPQSPPVNAATPPPKDWVSKSCPLPSNRCHADQHKEKDASFADRVHAKDQHAPMPAIAP